MTHEPVTPSPPGNDSELKLADRSRVGVVGAGPAGSLFACSLLEMAARVGVAIRVDIYESRDFNRSSPQGCNMCRSIASESLVQNLAAEGCV